MRTIGFTAERKKGARSYIGIDSTRLSTNQVQTLANDLPLPLYRHHLLPGLNKLRKNTSNTRVVYWNSRLLSMWQGGLPYKLDALALSTDGKSRLGGAILKDSDPFGAKMVIDPIKQRALFYAVQDANPANSEICLYEFDKNFKLVGNLDKDGNPKRLSMKVPGYAIINDFAATTNYAVFIQPTINVNAFKYIVDQSPGVVLSESGNGSTLHLMPRPDSMNKSPISINIPAADDDITDANIHFCNAYEDESNNVIIDLIRSDSRNIMKINAEWPWVSSLKDYQALASKKSLWRYTVDVKTKKVSKTLLCNEQVTFGNVNPVVSTRKHRYIYMNVGALNEQVAPPQGIARYDCDSGTLQKWVPNSYEFCGEPMYVPRRRRNEESKQNGNDNNVSNGSAIGDKDNDDDGYILSVLFNGKTETSEMVILEAHDIQKGPVSRISLGGVKVPHGLFGCFVPASSSDSAASSSYETIERRAKLADKMESRGAMWNEVKSDFSGMGLRLDDMEEYFGDWNPFA